MRLSSDRVHDIHPSMYLCVVIFFRKVTPGNKFHGVGRWTSLLSTMMIGALISHSLDNEFYTLLLVGKTKHDSFVRAFEANPF